ncbi:MAG: AAA family ATPase, partial [Pseudomonadota bacterium]
VILQNLQNDLEQKHARGERCVVLVDEAHAMPLETLEELRLLYNLQVGKHKLLQIVLFGQPELDSKLAQINMRQLKDRIVHHFTILPLSPQIIHAYLMFRMRAAGYKGPDIFTPDAEKMIGKASQGLMRRVNILADKSLLAAFVENTHKIDIRHVQAAIRDSEMTPMHHWLKRRSTHILGGVGLLVCCAAVAVWFLQRELEPASPANHVAVIASTLPASAVVPTLVANPTSAPVAVSSVSASENNAAASSGVAAASSVTATASLPNEHVTAEQPDKTSAATKEHTRVELPAKLKVAPASPAPNLLNSRLEATRAMLASATKGSASIQLFYTDGGAQERMEAFLLRAKKFKNLDDIYVLPIKLRGHDAYRVLYGVYASSEDARTGMEKLPKRYLDAFAPTLHLLDNSQNLP